MIMALNLSDKIYLAADTRVTEKPSLKTIDNVIKITPIWSRSIQGQPFYDKNELFIAVAGDVEFATYFFEEIKNAIAKKELPADVRELYEKIDEFSKNLVDIWTTDLKKDYRNFCVIIGGLCKYRKKKIEKNKLLDLINRYQKMQEKNIPKGSKAIQDALDSGDSTMQQMNAAMLRDRGKTAIEVLEEGYRVILPPHLIECLTDGQNFEHPDSLVFGVEIDMKTGIFQKEKAEWGEYLAYGAKGITKEDIDPEIVALFEISRPIQKPEMLENTILGVTILDTAKKKEAASIGGTVTIFTLSKDGATFATKDRDNSIPPHKPVRLILGGKSHETVFFYMYKKNESQKEAEL